MVGVPEIKQATEVSNSDSDNDKQKSAHKEFNDPAKYSNTRSDDSIIHMLMNKPCHPS